MEFYANVMFKQMQRLRKGNVYANVTFTQMHRLCKLKQRYKNAKFSHAIMQHLRECNVKAKVRTHTCIWR